MSWIPKNFIPYNETHQSRDHAPDAYEDLLGDALEAAFARGATDLPQLVKVLNERAVPPPGGATWTTDMLAAELRRLGA